ncbi:MAG: sigma-70 family RNA polymerase sigma factor, partial [Verrucomicrobiota bacterium]
QRLLAEYLKGSEPAFRELISRYLDLVYSTAIRSVNGDSHLAEDVAQTVFADFARMARTFSSDVMLGGWLHRHTCFVAATVMRTERRRQSRERQAVEMNALDDHSEANLAQVAPVLDEAINQLGARDRTAILLRFFEQNDLRAVGEALGSSEDAAQKCVTRALEKLRGLLKNRGVSFSATALGTVLAAEAVTAAPTGLAISISGMALASAAASGATALTFLKILSMTKLKLGIISAVVVAGVATPLVMQHQAIARLRSENNALQQKSAPTVESSAPAANAEDLERIQKERRELYRLRGEVGQLRNRMKDLSKLQEENGRLRPARHVGGEDEINYNKSEMWADHGFGSPLDALQTLHWAVHTGNIEKFKESIVITDEARNFLNSLLEKMYASVPPEEAAKMKAEIAEKGWKAEEGIMFPMMAQDQQFGYAGYRILSQGLRVPDELSVNLQLDMKTGKPETRRMRFKRFGNEWKQILDLNDLPEEVRKQGGR